MFNRFIVALLTMINSSLVAEKLVHEGLNVVNLRVVTFEKTRGCITLGTTLRTSAASNEK